MSGEALIRIFRDVCAMEAEPDAMTYLVDSIRVADIRPEDAYGGKRVTLQSRLGKTARLSIQVDVGIGDAVSPEPVWLEYPSLLQLPGARLRAYRPETAIAEKFHAMVTLGAKNSRMRDFFDIDALAKHESFDGRVLTEAMRATFERRGTPLPSSLPLALTPAFAESSAKQAQWAGFLKKNRLDTSGNLAAVVERLARFLGPLINAVRDGSSVSVAWQAGGPWQLDADLRESEVES